MKISRAGPPRCRDGLQSRMHIRSLVSVATAAICFALGISAPATAAPLAIASADAYVTRAYPHRTFGERSRLRVAADPMTRAYIRFRVREPLPPFADLILRVYVVKAGRDPLVVRRVRNSRWSESRITFANAPRPRRWIARGSPEAESWLSFDVSSAGRRAGLRSFVIVARSADTTDKGATTSLASGKRARKPRLVLDTAPPTTPLELKVSSATPESVSLAWNPSTDDVGVAGYEVYKDGVAVTKVPVTSATLPGLACASSYSFAVAAFDVAGKRSAVSEPLVARTEDCDLEPPSQPTRLTVSSASSSQLSLSWSASSDNVGVAGYDVLRDGVQVAQVATTSATISQLSCNTPYSFSIVAYDRAGNRSLLSEPLSAVTAPCSTSGAIYWGARIAGNVYGTGDAPFDWSAVTAFEEATEKEPSIVHFYAPFAHDCTTNGCEFNPFSTNAFERVRQHGMIPMLTWSSASAPISATEPDFQNADIVSGRYDTYITNWAKAAKSWDHPFFLRLNREMNGRWYPWSPGVNGNTAADFVAAWRHVHDLFASVGATNVTWVWCPNVDPNGKLTPFSDVYPGDAYVDWTCLDGYNFGTTWRSFDAIFGSSYLVLTGSVAPTRPLMIGEVGSVEAGDGSKAAWITEALAGQLPTNYPRVKAFLWFNSYNSGYAWPIESSASSQAAFASGITSSYYTPAAAKLGSLPPASVPPPS